MAKKVISYRLNPDGSVPDFVESGGYFAKDANHTDNMICLGISKDGADCTGAVQEFATASEAIAYVSTYLSDSVYPGLDGKDVVFTVADAVSALFDGLATV